MGEYDKNIMIIIIKIKWEILESIYGMYHILI